jgi:hypothetical protein
MAEPLKETLIAKLLASKGHKPLSDSPESTDWLRMLLDETIERDQPFWNEPRTWFRASSAGEACERYMTFDAMGHGAPFEARMLRVFRLGNAVEASNVPVFYDAGILVHPQPGEPQEEIVYEGAPDEKLLVGHYDLLVKRRDTGELLLGEIKSIKMSNFKKLAHPSDIPAENVSNLLRTHPKYVAQWTMYAGSEQVNTKHGFILFENKDDSYQKIYSLVVDEDLKAAILERLMSAWQYIRDIDNQRLAPIPANRSPGDPRDPVCKWCSAQYLCRRLPVEGTDYATVRAEDAKLRG